MNDRIARDDCALATVPFIVYESAIMKRDIIIGRLCAFSTIALAALLASGIYMARAMIGRR